MNLPRTSPKESKILTNNGNGTMPIRIVTCCLAAKVEIFINLIIYPEFLIKKRKHIMKILFVCSANVWGGNEKWTSMAISQLRRQNKVFLCYKNKNLSDKFGMNSSGFRAPFRNYTDLTTFYKIFCFVKKHKIDIIVSTKKKEYFICGVVAKLAGIKNVLRLGSLRKLDKPVWHNIVYDKLNHGMIVNAHRIKQTLLQYDFMHNNKIKVIYNGIVQDEVNEHILKTDNMFSITSAGRLTKPKGFHILIRAVAELPVNIRQKIQVKIIGDGPYRKELEDLAKKLNVFRNVHFSGFVNTPQRIIAASDVFVLLSLNEGLSNSLLEAMINGVPVLTTDAGGVREFIKHKKNGFITRSINPSDIASELKNIIENREESASIGREGRKTVAELFSMDKMGTEIENFLKKVIAA